MTKQRKWQSSDNIYSFKQSSKGMDICIHKLALKQPGQGPRQRFISFKSNQVGSFLLIGLAGANQSFVLFEGRLNGAESFSQKV